MTKLPVENAGSSAFIISGVSSGSGKTTVTLGLMAAFYARGYAVQPFKCGPDFIDPGLHRLACHRISRNLDLWMSGSSWCRTTFSRHSKEADIAIIEGVMGMYDGGDSSSATLANELDLANILVIDVRSMAESAAAILKGFATLKENARVDGVILNRIGSPRHLELIEQAVKKFYPIPILGYLPRSVEFTIPSRHLGLLTADESPIAEDQLKSLVAQVEQHIDLDALLNLAKRRPEKEHQTGPTTSLTGQCRLGVARDKAFCFYYQDNLELLAAAGCELIFFSPMDDQLLPENLDALYLGGGYPELYAATLSANGTMRDSILDFIEDDGVVWAECGGFMYLTEGITDHQGSFHPMVGAFPTRARMHGKRSSLGYRELTTTAKSCFGPAKTLLRGHEFHYSSIAPMDERVPRIFNQQSRPPEGYLYKRCLGGYMHLHLGFTEDAPQAFINYCKQ